MIAHALVSHWNGLCRREFPEPRRHTEGYGSLGQPVNQRPLLHFEALRLPRVPGTRAELSTRRRDCYRFRGRLGMTRGALVVPDTGICILAEQQKVLFEAFGRLTARSTEDMAERA